MSQITGELTDGGEDVGEAEVVDGVERQQVEEELLLLLLTAQEGVTLVQLSVAQSTTPPGQARLGHRESYIHHPLLKHWYPSVTVCSTCSRWQQ